MGWKMEIGIRERWEEPMVWGCGKSLEKNEKAFALDLALS